jgi:hypothetical protein
MDSISLIQTMLPIIVALPFTVISIVSLEKLIADKVESVLTPLWCFFASFSWIATGLLNIYGVTTQYFVAFSWLFIGLGLMFLILAFYALVLDIKLAARTDSQRREEDEMRLQ